VYTPSPKKHKCEICGMVFENILYAHRHESIGCSLDRIYSAGVKMQFTGLGRNEFTPEAIANIMHRLNFLFNFKMVWNKIHLLMNSSWQEL
jgi:hypothetical protein